MEVRVDLPAKANVLFEPHRFKVLYGGRASGKSWSIARALLISGVCKPERILCVRETQASIMDTVFELLLDQIYDLGLSSFYKTTNNSIVGHNGTKFVFAGLRNNISQIKAMENVTKC
jgi:phage terminase large subunit